MVKTHFRTSEINHFNVNCYFFLSLSTLSHFFFLSFFFRANTTQAHNQITHEEAAAKLAKSK